LVRVDALVTVVTATPQSVPWGFFIFLWEANPINQFSCKTELKMA